MCHWCWGHVIINLSGFWLDAFFGVKFSKFDPIHPVRCQHTPLKLIDGDEILIEIALLKGALPNLDGINSARMPDNTIQTMISHGMSEQCLMPLMTGIFVCWWRVSRARARAYTSISSPQENRQNNKANTHFKITDSTSYYVVNDCSRNRLPLCRLPFRSHRGHRCRTYLKPIPIANTQADYVCLSNWLCARCAVCAVLFPFCTLSNQNIWIAVTVRRFVVRHCGVLCIPFYHLPLYHFVICVVCGTRWLT